MATLVKNVNLVYKGEIVGTYNIDHPNEIKNAIAKWYYQIKPALKRQETIKIEVELIGS